MKEHEEVIPVKVGDLMIFMGKKMVLAHTGNNMVALINIHTGHAWQPLTKVENLEDITAKEFQEVSGGFELPTAYAEAELKLKQNVKT